MYRPTGSIKASTDTRMPLTLYRDCHKPPPASDSDVDGASVGAGVASSGASVTVAETAVGEGSTVSVGVADGWRWSAKKTLIWLPVITVAAQRLGELET
jgi:hypothetical protein